MQQKKVESLQRAMDVRKNGSKVGGALLPATTPKDPSAINNIAWSKVSWDPKEREWCDEVRGLARARRAVQFAAEQNSDKRSMFGDTLAWALFANGLDDEAMATSKAALASAPEAEKKEYEGYVQKIEKAIADVPTALIEAQTVLARLDAEGAGQRGLGAFNSWRIAVQYRSDGKCRIQRTYSYLDREPIGRRAIPDPSGQ